jgi:glutaminyl-peptide cyclotransferase
MDKRRVAAGLVLIIAVVLAGILVMTMNSGQLGNSASNKTVHYTYEIKHTYPHDTSAFTEGLIFSNSSIYESTGGSGDSSLRRVDLETGRVLQEYNLSSEYFGEGLALVDDSLIQLTWQSHIGFVYNVETFAIDQNFTYSTQGWGLTYDGNSLIMSDGSLNLTYFSPETFQVTHQVSVKDGNQSITNINELEYINGDVYANVWMTNRIAIINPQTGQVKGWIDLSGLYQSNDFNSVLNGIAYDQQTGRLFVTGKNWPNLYEIIIKPVE